MRKNSIHFVESDPEYKSSTSSEEEVVIKRMMSKKRSTVEREHSTVEVPDDNERN